MGVNSLFKTVTRQRPYCAWVQHANLSATEPPKLRSGGSFIAESVSEKKLKSVNIWHSYRQEGGLFRALYASGHHIAKRRIRKCTRQLTDSSINLACNFANIYWLKNFTDRLINKLFLIFLLTSPPHLKCIATQPSNLSPVAFFLALMFHKVVSQCMPGIVGPIILVFLQIY